MRSAHDAIHEKIRKKDEIAANKAKLAAFGQARSVGASLSTIIGEGSGRGYMGILNLTTTTSS